MQLTEEEVQVIRFTKGIEHYVFVYTKANKSEALHRLGTWAEDPRLSIDFYDAARIAHAIRSWK